MDIKQVIASLRDEIDEAIQDRNCPEKHGLNMTLCNAVPNCTCRECWMLAVMYALKEDVQ